MTIDTVNETDTYLYPPYSPLPEKAPGLEKLINDFNKKKKNYNEHFQSFIKTTKEFEAEIDKFLKIGNLL